MLWTFVLLPTKQWWAQNLYSVIHLKLHIKYSLFNIISVLVHPDHTPGKSRPPKTKKKKKQPELQLLTKSPADNFIIININTLWEIVYLTYSQIPPLKPLKPWRFVLSESALTPSTGELLNTLQLKRQLVWVLLHLCCTFNIRHRHKAAGCRFR